MLSRFDRVQVSTREPEEVAQKWIQLLDAKETGRDKVSPLSAARISLAIGDCSLEILSPDGPGILATHLEQNPAGPFAAGFAAPDLEHLKASLSDKKVNFRTQGEQIFLLQDDLAIPGLQLVISQDRPTSRQGIMENLYETTHLTSDEEKAAATFADIFNVQAEHFVPINSDNYGYKGCLTLVNPDELDRIEIINPYDLEKTMGRYFKKFGTSLYMCFGECDNLPLLRERLQELVPNDWTGEKEGPVDSLFIHPKALGGVMLGVSRTTFAWSWSGSPDRIKPV